MCIWVFSTGFKTFLENIEEFSMRCNISRDVTFYLALPLEPVISLSNFCWYRVFSCICFGIFRSFSPTLQEILSKRKWLWFPVFVKESSAGTGKAKKKSKYLYFLEISIQDLTSDKSLYLDLRSQKSILRSCRTFAMPKQDTMIFIMCANRCLGILMCFNLSTANIFPRKTIFPHSSLLNEELLFSSECWLRCTENPQRTRIKVGHVIFIDDQSSMFILASQEM